MSARKAKTKAAPKAKRKPRRKAAAAAVPPVAPVTAAPEAEEETRGRGRPTDYDPKYVDQARKLTELGATDADIAEFFEVSERTIYRWAALYPDFCQALKVGKAQADDRVERSLFHRANGYTHDAVKIFNTAEGPVIVPFRQHVPPDTTAAIFWLKNRRKAEWRDTKEIEIPPADDDASPEALNEKRAAAVMAMFAEMQAKAAKAAADEAPAKPAGKAKPRKRT